MPTLPKGNRPTLAVKARATVVKEKRRAFRGIDRSNTKLYTSRHWRKVRRLILNAQPICVHCEQNGRYITANTVDHIVPINKGGALFSHENLQALCSSCHNKKSATDK